MYLDKLSSFLRCYKCAQLNQNRLNSTVRESCDTIQEFLGLPRIQAQKLIKSNGLSKVNEENLTQSLQLLTSLGYTNREITDNAKLLGRSSKKLQDQYLVLTEVGFRNITPIILVNFRKLIHKAVRTLKNYSFLPQDCHVVNNLLVQLNPKPDDFFNGYNYNENDIVAQMHAVIIKKYLEWRLEATADEIETFFRKNRTLKFKSFRNICENIDFALNLGFPPKKLLSYDYVLTTDPSYPKTLIKQMPIIADLDMKIAMRRYPKLVTISPKNFNLIYEILKNEQIPDEFIKNDMNIFTLSPKTVKLRLEELKRIPELNILRGNPRILKLIVHHRRTRSRLTIMKDMDLKCCSMIPLGYGDDELFDSRVKSGKDKHLGYEVVLLLKNLLKADGRIIKGTLNKHPHHLEIPLIEIEKSVKFLQMKFSNEAILKVLPIVLYPIGKIRNALNVVNAMKDLPTDNLTETKKLNLVLYIMEKCHHFTGDGVW